MQFVFAGFTQDRGFRVFAFERMGEDRILRKYAVRADTALLRSYGIKMQELALLCRGFLEKRDNNGETGPFTFSEHEMSLYAKACTAAREAAALRKKPLRRSPTEVV